MAIFNGSVFSKSLTMATSLTVCLPNDTVQRPDGGFPVLYLLHGFSDDHTAWTRRTNIDRYATEQGLAVVMPEVQHSFYCNMKYGMNYFDWISDELPKLCREMFGLTAKREETFVAGLSMGGYGALRCGLKRPDVFSACASLSGAVDVKKLAAQAEEGMMQEFRGIVGEDLRVDKDSDLFCLAPEAAKFPDSLRPAVMTCCGTEDSLYADNLRFRDLMRTTGLRYEYREGPGIHNWAYWEQMIRPVLDFLMEGRKEKNPD